MGKPTMRYKIYSSVAYLLGAIACLLAAHDAVAGQVSVSPPLALRPSPPTPLPTPTLTPITPTVTSPVPTPQPMPAPQPVTSPTIVAPPTTGSIDTVLTPQVSAAGRVTIPQTSQLLIVDPPILTTRAGVSSARDTLSAFPVENMSDTTLTLALDLLSTAIAAGGVSKQATKLLQAEASRIQTTLAARQ